MLDPIDRATYIRYFAVAILFFVAFLALLGLFSALGVGAISPVGVVVLLLMSATSLGAWVLLVLGTLKRLAGIGVSRWLALLTLIPYIGWLLPVYLLFATEARLLSFAKRG